MKLDILVLASHPDDAELGCSGTIAAHVAKGYKVGVVDMTRGELGTRGSVELRAQEANYASAILGLSIRENLGLRDGFFSEGEEECIAIARVIRKYQPEIILGNAPEDRHPDHGRAGKLIVKAGFLSGLAKIEIVDKNVSLAPWRAKYIFHYIQDKLLTPDFVIDITPHWQKKLESIQAFSSQFYTPGSSGPETYISTANFMRFVEARALEMGHSIGVTYGEGFIKTRQLKIDDLTTLL